MIHNLKGTSGSGKSYIARALMAALEAAGWTRNPVFRDGRKKPIAYEFAPSDPAGIPVAVLGHYETPCGGCDTIHNMADVFELVRRYHDSRYNVFFEGVIVGVDFRLTHQLHKDGLPLRVILLDTPIETCVASVNDRRAARAKPGQIPEPLDPKNTLAKFRASKGACERLTREGADVRILDRAGALELVLRELGPR